MFPYTKVQNRTGCRHRNRNTIVKNSTERFLNTNLDIFATATYQSATQITLRYCKGIELETPKILNTISEISTKPSWKG